MKTPQAPTDLERLAQIQSAKHPRERIWQGADRLRAAHPAGRSLPVQVLDLAEFDLGLDLIPANGLREQLDIEALLRAI